MADPALSACDRAELTVSMRSPACCNHNRMRFTNTTPHVALRFLHQVAMHEVLQDSRYVLIMDFFEHYYFEDE